MLRVIAILVGLGIYIWFIIDVLRTPGVSVRTLPKPLWLVIVFLLPLIGGVIWLVWGRPRPEPRRGRRGRPIAPDDDPRFMRQLDEQAWRQRMRRRRGEE